MTSSSPGGASGGLVLLGHGPAGQVRELLLQAGPRLAAALALPWAGCLDPAEPESALASLAETLVGLPLDPGQSLARGGHWAEALGAHRQPVLVVLSPAQATSGMAACSEALLRQQGVPLLGLVQAGGAWDAAARRREPLPWLGVLADGPGTAGAEDAAVTLALAVRLRLAQLRPGPQG